MTLSLRRLHTRWARVGASGLDPQGQTSRPRDDANRPTVRITLQESQVPLAYGTQRCPPPEGPRASPTRLSPPCAGDHSRTRLKGGGSRGRVDIRDGG